MTARDIALVVATNLRAALKRLLAWLRDEPLIDIRLLPDDLRTALKPLVRPTVRYLTVPQAQQLIEAACALMASYERLFVQQSYLAKSAAGLELASAMAALAYQPGDSLPMELERQLAGQRTR
jgi:hypothetical protein